MTCLSLNGVLQEWIGNTKDFQFKDKKYDRELVLVMNRMMCFDLNKVDSESASSMLKSLWLLTKNRMALELLSLKYSSTILRFYKICLSQYMKSDMDTSAELITSVSALLVRILSNSVEMKDKDRDWKRFKKQSSSLLLLTLYKSCLLLKIGAVFGLMDGVEQQKRLRKCIDDHVADSILTVLIQIPVTLQKQHNHELVQLIKNQLVQSECAQIIGFTFNVLGQQQHDKQSVSVISKCFQCATSFLNFEHNVLSATVLKNEHKVEQLLSAVLTLIVEKFQGNDDIFG